MAIESIRARKAGSKVDGWGQACNGSEKVGRGPGGGGEFEGPDSEGQIKWERMQVSSSPFLPCKNAGLIFARSFG